MGDIVNLKRARKDAAKARASGLAAENRVKFGRSKAEKAAARREQASVATILDGAKLDPK